ncbi:8734_t:CDS:2, partial [Paraglomus brasilianum]
STRKRTIPNPDSPTEYSTDELYARSYGRSLMVGYCEAYQPDFVLMGLPKLDFQDLLESDLRESVQNFSLQGPISKSVCILANVDAPYVHNNTIPVTKNTPNSTFIARHCLML